MLHLDLFTKKNGGGDISHPLVRVIEVTWIINIHKSLYKNSSGK